MASAFETVIAAGPCERSAELARKALGPDQPTDVSAGGHVFVTAATALLFSERYDEAERAVRPCRLRRAPARLQRRLRGARQPARAPALPPRRAVGGGGRRHRGAGPAQRRPGLAGLPRVRAQRARLRPPRTRRGRPGAAHAGRRLLRHPAHRGPPVQPGDARPRLAAGAARRRRGRPGGAAGLRCAGAAVGRRDAADHRLAVERRRGLPHARPARAGPRARRHGTPARPSDRRPAGDRRGPARRCAGRVG